MAPGIQSGHSYERLRGLLILALGEEDPRKLKDQLWRRLVSNMTYLEQCPYQSVGLNETGSIFRLKSF